jgi:hypothetical protein
MVVTVGFNLTCGDYIYGLHVRINSLLRQALQGRLAELVALAV